MGKRDTVVVFLGVMLLLLSLSVVSSVVASSSQVSVYRFDAKGGVHGPPDKKPKPPKEVAVEYELFIEIDYMEGHEPNSTVLDYVHTYYLERGINVTFIVDEEILYNELNLWGVDPENGINDYEFGLIEEKVNNLGDDKNGTGDPNFGTAEVYSSKWKWVLYGNAVEDEKTHEPSPFVMGYTHVILSIKYVPPTGRILSVDCLAGNYIFIADGAGDSWALSVGIEPYGAEAVVLMHELGHSIGIMNVGWSGNVYTGFTLWEIYDSDLGSVMSYLSEANAGLYGAWYYSDEYWRLRNMEYYTT